MSPFEVAQAIQSANVGVFGLDLRRTVLRFVDVGKMAVIRFRWASQRIDKFGGSHEGKVKRHPVTSATVAHVRIDNERAGPPPSPIQTYKQSLISTATAAAAAAAAGECRQAKRSGCSAAVVVAELSILRFTAPDYSFGIFNLFLPDSKEKPHVNCLFFFYIQLL
jgi:hypothetical protein